MNELGYDPLFPLKTNQTRGYTGRLLTPSYIIDDLKGFCIKNNGKEIACVLKKV